MASHAHAVRHERSADDGAGSVDEWRCSCPKPLFSVSALLDSFLYSGPSFLRSLGIQVLLNLLRDCISEVVSFLRLESAPLTSSAHWQQGQGATGDAGIARMDDRRINITICGDGGTGTAHADAGRGNDTDGAQASRH